MLQLTRDVTHKFVANKQKGKQRMRSQSKANFTTVKNAQIKIKCIDLIQFSENARIFKLLYVVFLFFALLAFSPVNLLPAVARS